MSSKDRPVSREELIGKLIAAAGSGPTATEEARQRVYAAVHQRWQAATAGSKQSADAAQSDPAQADWQQAPSTGRDRHSGSVVSIHSRSARADADAPARTWPVKTLAMAAAVALAAVTLTWFNVDRPAPTETVELARFAKVEGDVELLRNGSDARAQDLSGQPAGIQAGDTLVTGPEGRAALRFGDDLIIRANVDSRIAFASDSEIELIAGTVYVDSNGADDPLSIATPFGPVAHLGTQYELHLNDSALRLRVREGSVAYGGQTDEIVGQAGEQLIIDDTGLASRDLIAADDAAWQWATELATLASADEYRLDDVLTWIARERGLELNIAGNGAPARIGDRLLRGLDGLSPDEALEAAAIVAGFDYEIRDGELAITP